MRLIPTPQIDTYAMECCNRKGYPPGTYNAEESAQSAAVVVDVNRPAIVDVEEVPKLMLTKSKAQRRIGGSNLVTAEIVFCSEAEDRTAISVVGEYVCTISFHSLWRNTQCALSDAPYVRIYLLSLYPFEHSWNNWDPISLDREEESELWSTLCVVTPGYHEFYFLLDNEEVVISNRHSRTSRAPNRRQLNWRNFESPREHTLAPVPGRKSLVHSASSLAVDIWNASGTFELHENGGLPSKLQGSFSFPPAPSIIGDATEDAEDEVDETGIVFRARIPLALVMVGSMYFTGVGVRTAWRLFQVLLL